MVIGLKTKGIIIEPLTALLRSPFPNTIFCVESTSDTTQRKGIIRWSKLFLQAAEEVPRI